LAVPPRGESRRANAITGRDQVIAENPRLEPPESKVPYPAGDSEDVLPSASPRRERPAWHATQPAARAASLGA
jgi:hypothetical protein